MRVIAAQMMARSSPIPSAEEMRDLKEVDPAIIDAIMKRFEADGELRRAEEIKDREHRSKLPI